MSSSSSEIFLLCMGRNNVILPQLIKEMIWDEIKFQNLSFLLETFGHDIRIPLSSNKNVTLDMIERTINRNNIFWDFNRVFSTERKGINFSNAKYIKQLLKNKNLNTLAFRYTFHRPDITFDNMLSVLHDGVLFLPGDTFNETIIQQTAAMYFYQNKAIPSYFPGSYFYLSQLKEFCLNFVITEVFEQRKYHMNNTDWLELSSSVSLKEAISMADAYPHFFKNCFCPNVVWHLLSYNENNTFEDIVSAVNDKRFSSKIDWYSVSKHANVTIDDVLKTQLDPELSKIYKWVPGSLKCLSSISFVVFERLYKENVDFLKNYIPKIKLYGKITGINISNVDDFHRMMVDIYDESYLPRLIRNKNMSFDVVEYLIVNTEIYSKWRIGRGTCGIQKFRMPGDGNITFDEIKKSLQDPKISLACQWDLGKISRRSDLTFDNIKELIYNPIFENLDGKLDWFSLSKNKNVKLNHILSTLEDKNFEWNFPQLRCIEEYKF